MSDTPETDDCVKENKHIKFLEEDHWSLNGKFTFTHPIVALCRKLERQLYGLGSAADCVSDLLTDQRNRFIKAIEALKYWRDISECDCSNSLPHGGCLRCDLDRILKETNQNDGN